MLIVTHEMEFERDVAPRMVFMDKEIIEEEGEEGTPEQVFYNPRKERTREFLRRTLKQVYRLGVGHLERTFI